MRWYELYELYGECMKECKVKVLGYTGGRVGVWKLRREEMMTEEAIW
jgi:hypothetical protein